MYAHLLYFAVSLPAVLLISVFIPGALLAYLGGTRLGSWIVDESGKTTKTGNAVFFVLAGFLCYILTVCAIRFETYLLGQ